MNIVMVVSMVLCAAIGLWGVFDPDAMTAAAQALVNYSLTALDWFFLLLCTFFFVFMVAIGFSRYGNIKLGGDDEVPEFSTPSWVAMLFAAGMGSGLLFWGVAEPIYHFSSPPGGMAGETPEAARQAFVITNFHWGFHAWSIYGCCALVIAYGTFRLGLPSMISTPILVGLKNIFTPRALKGIGSTADVLAVVAVIFGLAGSLAMGTLMVRSGMHSVFGTDSGSTTISFAILAALTVCFLLSASTGVDKGIKILSNINMIVAIIILLVVLFGGPTAYLFQVFVNSIGDYLIQFIPLSFKIYSFQPPASWNWFHGWTLTYLIWWLAWGPFVGIFIARISRGRTIREFMVGVMFVPTTISFFWLCMFGGNAMYMELTAEGGAGTAGIVELVRAWNLPAALYGTIDGLTDLAFLQWLMAALATLLLATWFITSSDSGTLVITTMLSMGDDSPPQRFRIVWGLGEGFVAGVLLLAGGLTALQTASIAAALPISVIMLFMTYGLLKSLSEDSSYAPATAAA
jgi:glycine betaine transporter